MVSLELYDSTIPQHTDYVYLQDHDIRADDSSDISHSMNQLNQWKTYAKWTKFGGYDITGTHCRRLVIFSIFIIYQLSNVGFVIYQLFGDDRWCIPFLALVFQLQFNDFFAYITAFAALNTIQSKHIEFMQRAIRSPTKRMLILLLIPTASTYISGINVIFEWNEYPGSDDVVYSMFLIVFWVLDVLKYTPVFMITLVLHQILNSFTDRIEAFDLGLTFQRDDIVEDTAADHRATLWKSRSVQEYDHIVRCDKTDHKWFMQSFNAMIGEYRVILKEFQMFWGVLFVCNVLTWAFNIWTFIWRVRPQSPCTTDAWLMYSHIEIEVLFFEFMWMLLIWRLARNQSLIKEYRDDFSATVVMENGQKSFEKLIIMDYLDTIVHDRSPFKVYGFIPTPQKIGWLFTAVLGPMTFTIVRYALQYASWNSNDS